MHNPLTGHTVTPRRLVGRVEGRLPGPTLLVLCCVHGNEPSGLFGLDAVLHRLANTGLPLRGTLVGIAVNLAALARKSRFVDRDLNRMWSRERLDHLRQTEAFETVEDRELLATVDLIRQHRPDHDERHFLDLHTTSSESVPYISCLPEPDCVNLASHLPAHTVIGGDARLIGISDEYLVEDGWTGFTFEAGQHDALASVEAQEAVIWTTLQQIGCIERVPGPFRERLARTQTEGAKRFRIEHIHRLRPGVTFRMLPGFFNFQKVHQGQLLAWENDRPIRSDHDARIFLPLYQSQGDDGFSLVTEADK